MNTSWKLTLIIGTVCVVGILAEESRVRAARTRTQEAALEALNVIAVRDSTRDVSLENARVARLVSDSLRVVEKRVVQVKQSRDALDEALRREKKAAYALSVYLDSLSVERTAPSSARSGATFHVRDGPYTVDADVALPPPPDSATLRLRIALDTMAMRLRVTCRDFTDAAVVVETPSWAQVALGAVSQDPEVCASRRERPSRSSLHLRIRPVIGGGRVVTGPRNGWGAFVGVGLTLGFDE